uniref:Uncharacterized protein n=1 Tax=Macaca fascicularis TaxID=9541 RepID=A0A7N9D2K7_MACFA
MLVPALCLLWVLAMVIQPASAPVSSPELAEHEELTLLFHGTLQLGQALNGVYKTTEGPGQEQPGSLWSHSGTPGAGGQPGPGCSPGTSGKPVGDSDGGGYSAAEGRGQPVLEEVAQAQKVLQDSVRQLEVQLRSAWLGPAYQEFEVLKVRGSPSPSRLRP